MLFVALTLTHHEVLSHKITRANGVRDTFAGKSALLATVALGASAGMTEKYWGIT
jgi:hypothetical protein